MRKQPQPSTQKPKNRVDPKPIQALTDEQLQQAVGGSILSHCLQGLGNRLTPVDDR